MIPNVFAMLEMYTFFFLCGKREDVGTNAIKTKHRKEGVGVTTRSITLRAPEDVCVCVCV